VEFTDFIPLSSNHGECGQGLKRSQLSNRTTLCFRGLGVNETAPLYSQIVGPDDENTAPDPTKPLKR